MADLAAPFTPGASLQWRTPATSAARLASGLTTFAAVLVFFTMVTATLLWPWLAHVSHALIGPPEDNMQDLWNTWYATVAANPAHFFYTNLLRFPHGTPLNYQSFAYPQVFAVAALSHVFGSDISSLIALHNLTLLASFPLAGVGAFYLVRHLTGSTVGGLIGGIIFAFSPFHIAHAAHHAHVATIEFLPFFVLAFLLALEKQSLFWLGVASVLFALSALSCWYYLFYCAYFLAFQMLYQRVRQGAWPRGWPFLASLLCVVLTIAILSPLLLPMLESAGSSVYKLGGNIFVADLLGYFTFPPQHIFSSVSRALFDRFTGTPWEATVYLGLVNVGVLLWHWRRTGLARESLTFYCGLGMLFFGVLAAGEALHIGGTVTFIPLPDAALDRLPFFANVRTPSRAIVFVYLFMSVGVGAAAAAMWRQSAPASRCAMAVIAALIVLDFWPTGLQTTSIGQPSPGFRFLTADADADFGVLNLPWGYIEENSYMLEQIYHGRPIVDGMTTREVSTSFLYGLPLKDLGRQREQLVHGQVKYILVHKPHHGLFAWNREFAPLAQFLKTYRPVYEDRQLTILRVY